MAAILLAGVVNVGASNARIGPAGGMTYHGGLIMPTAVTKAIFWGPKWSNSAFAADKITGLDSFYSGFGGSNYAKISDEYTQSNGVHVGPTTTYQGHLIDLSNASGGGSTSAILAEVAKMITAPDPGGNGYYAVYTDLPRGNAGYCGWHSSGTVRGVRVQFAFFWSLDGDPGCDPTDSSGLHSEGLAALATVSAHELSEARTDPNNGGWYDSRGQENGNKCNFTFFRPLVTLSNGSRWKLQGEWSNSAFTAGTGYANSSGQRGCLAGDDWAMAIASNPTSLTAGTGHTATVEILTSAIDASGGPIALSVSGAPAGTQVSLDPATVPPGGSSTLSITPGTTAAADRHAAADPTSVLTVNAIQGANTDSTPIALTTTTSTADDFSIVPDPGGLFVNQGGSGTFNIATTVVSGSAGAVALSVSGAPAGSSASLSPSTVTAGNPSTLTLTVNDAAPGNYSLLITGTEGSASHSVTVPVTVTSSPAITSAPSATFFAGLSGSFSVTTSGSPQPGLSEEGPLPSGLTFQVNPDGPATISGTPAPGTEGSYPITIHADSPVGSDTQTLTLIVTKEATKLTASPTTLLLPMFSARLVGASDGLPVARRTVSFSVSGQTVCSATTNADGIASCSGLLALGQSYTANFAGDQSYLASSATAPITLL